MDEEVQCLVTIEIRGALCWLTGLLQTPYFVRIAFPLPLSLSLNFLNTWRTSPLQASSRLKYPEDNEEVYKQ